MSSESVCQVARSWVDVGSFRTCLVVLFMILQYQFGIFWIHRRISEEQTGYFFRVEARYRCGRLGTEG
jgi:hypothetical protein